MAFNNINNLSHVSNYKVFLPVLSSEVMYVQGIQLPGISMTPMDGYNRGLNLRISSDSYELDPVTITLIADENFDLIKRIYSIFKDAVHPNNSTFGPDFHFECAIEVTNNSGIPVFGLELHRCVLQNIGSAQLSSNQEDEIINLDLTIVPSYYEVIDKLEDAAIYDKIIKS